MGFKGIAVFLVGSESSCSIKAFLVDCQILPEVSFVGIVNNVDMTKRIAKSSCLVHPGWLWLCCRKSTSLKLRADSSLVWLER